MPSATPVRGGSPVTFVPHLTSVPPVRVPGTRTREVASVAEFDIQFTILRDGEEIGFGACLGSTFDQAAYAVGSVLDCREWETDASMPDPKEVDL